MLACPIEVLDIELIVIWKMDLCFDENLNKTCFSFKKYIYVYL